MRLLTNRVVAAAALLIVAALLSAWWWYATDFDRMYKAFLRAPDPRAYFSDTLLKKSDGAALTNPTALKGFRDDMTGAHIYKRSRSLVIMYWHDTSGLSAPVIWKKANGLWRIVSL